MANSGKGTEGYVKIIFEADGGQKFPILVPPECKDCILNGVAADPGQNKSARRRRRTTGPMNKLQMSKRQLKRRAGQEED